MKRTGMLIAFVLVSLLGIAQHPGLSTPRLMTESLTKVLQKAKAEDELTVSLVLRERPIYLPFTVVTRQAESNIYLVKGKASAFKKYFEGNGFL
ncbi:MAG TPA: hypothetical protein VM843_04515, partial [Flavisolibacter sp.]|nr:hypothetical protein [Flavisolibacter sp.]